MGPDKHSFTVLKFSPLCSDYQYIALWSESWLACDHASCHLVLASLLHLFSVLLMWQATHFYACNGLYLGKVMLNINLIFFILCVLFLFFFRLLFLFCFVMFFFLNFKRLTIFMMKNSSYKRYLDLFVVTKVVLQICRP